MKAKPAIALAVAGLTLALSACGTETMYMIDYPYYATAQDLYSAATTVVVGTVQQSSAKMIDTSIPPGPAAPMAYTVHQVVVASAIKGDAQTGRNIEVGEAGGRVGGHTYRSSSGILMSKGNTYLMFLSCQSDPCYLMNPVASVYQVAADGTLKAMDGNSLTVADVAAVTGLG